MEKNRTSIDVKYLCGRHGEDACYVFLTYEEAVDFGMKHYQSFSVYKRVSTCNLVADITKKY